MDSLDMVGIITELELDGGVEMTRREGALVQRGAAADVWRIAVRLRPVGNATWQQVPLAS